MATSSAPLHAGHSNPSYHRSPAAAPHPLCHPTAPRYVSARAAPSSAMVVLIRLSNLDSDAADDSARLSSSDPLFSYTIWFFLWQVMANSLPPNLTTIDATLITHLDPHPSNDINVAALVNQRMPNMTVMICVGC
ncbi:hypothetical protein VPH35_138439 [Triticum aestivum]